VAWIIQITFDQCLELPQRRHQAGCGSVGRLTGKRSVRGRRDGLNVERVFPQKCLIRRRLQALAALHSRYHIDPIIRFPLSPAAEICAFPIGGFQFKVFSILLYPILKRSSL
jgi:hypothetical protein